ncbi:obscurin-like protein 1 isoform X2 [Poeciliopsis prolifica]|uniref:obscurin-like protein 1 isoform X2 n=1 Tax=Poeciliopsis prolifica TaxID=188132 RepID=UPI00241379C0|nr:obscurin-like protein 1 isoform X2 [Poeciliopsis prolifica]
MDVFGGAPRFLAYPRPVLVQSGTDAVLKCQIGGDPRPAVIWERNNEKIDPQGRYRVFEDGNVYNLIITAVTVEDSGQYICKAKNSIGETYAAATLKVEGEAQEMELREENKPRFLIKPLSTRVGRGEDAVFSCKLWGNPRPEVVWEKDGRKLNEIFESMHFNVGYQDGGWFQLKIFKTRAPDGGVYTCKARNEFGEALAGAVLLVDAGPGHEEEGNRNGYTNGHWKVHQGKQRTGRQVPTRLKDDAMTKSAKVKMFAVTEGKHAKFRCFVTGKPKPEIIWRKDGRLILSGRRYLLYEDREGYFTLKVLYCKQKDNGVYVCAASNTAGQTLSAVHLSVKEPPVQFKQPLYDLEVWERDLAVLECEVPEDSVPITWYLEDRRLQPGAKYGMEEWGTKRRLTIRDIGVDDDGIYLCEMPDGGRSIAEVAVKGTILRKLPRKVDVLEGENAAFCVEVEKEEMDIHWYKDGIELRETHQTILKSFGRTHILVFVNTMPQDSGLVTFLVGRSKTSSQLRVKAARHCPPSCPVGVQINTERANAALLSWVPAPDSRKNPPSGYVLERQEVGTGSQEWLQCLTTDSATSVEILGDSVPCEADYRFRICSVNKYGKSNNVEFPRTVHLVPVARIQAPLQDALVPEGQDALFTIELSASVIGTWFLNGTQLQDDERYALRRSRTHQSLRIRGVRDADNGAEITFIAYGIRDSAALYIQAPLVKFSPLSEMDRNKFVEVGNPIVLYCELSDPAAPVHWYKNGVELQTMEGLHIQSEGTMRRIVIQSADFSHSGVYCCDAIDDVIRFNVEVEAPPVRFSAIPDAERSKSIQAGGPFVLQCELSDPSAQVYWYKDGSKLHPQTGVDLKAEGLWRKLVVHSADVTHSGLYCCKMKGDAVTFSVDITAPPMKFSAISEDMKIKLIEAGSPIVLQCVVSDPEAQVCWFKEEMKLISSSGLEIHSVGNTRTLVIQSAEVTHSGVYRCATDDDTVEFQVEIKALPVTHSTIFDAERGGSLEVGNPVKVECEAAASTVPVCWNKDGKKLDPQKGWGIQSNGTPPGPVIPPTELLPSGQYCCQTTEATVHFSVDDKAPTLPPYREVGGLQALEATRPIEPVDESSDPASQVSWPRDSQSYSSRQFGFEMGDIKESLVIEPTHPSNSGAYYCATADDVAKLIVVNPVSPPTYVLDPDEKTRSTEEQYPIVQQFEISDPIAKACWYKDGTQIYPKRGPGTEEHSQILALVSQHLSDDGVPLREDVKAEQCHSRDLVGEVADASAQYSVEVKASPTLPVRIKTLQEAERNKAVEVGEPVVLRCEVSDPSAPVTWAKDGVKLSEESGQNLLTEGSVRTLAVQSATPSHAGIYICKTSHDAVQFYVDVKVPPLTFAALSEADQKMTVVAGAPIALQCALSDPSGQVSWYKDGRKLLAQSGVAIQSQGNVRSLVVPSAERAHTGVYRCESKDDDIQFSVEVKGLPVKFSKLPEKDRNRSVEEGKPFALSCELSHDPLAHVDWYKDGMKLGSWDKVEMKSDGLTRTLIIPSAESIHAGIYECSTSEDSITFKVDVKGQSPRIMATPFTEKYKLIRIGSPIFLQCEVSDPAAQVSWFKDELELFSRTGLDMKRDGTLRKLIVHSAKVSDSGLYSCRLAEEVVTFHVDIEATPVRFSKLPEVARSNFVGAGCPVELQCEVSETAAQVHRHTDGERLLETSEYETQTSENLRGLVVQSAEVRHSGLFSREATENHIQFKVDVAAVSEAQRSESVEAGNLIRVHGEIPAVQTCCSEDGIESSLEVQSKPDKGAVVMESSLSSCSGVCECEADDGDKDFKVKAPPVTFTDIPEKDLFRTAVEQEQLVLSCEVSRTDGAVQWYKDGTEIQPSVHVSLEADGAKRNLVIKSAKLSDSGAYTCRTGDNILIFKVNIREPPVMIVYPKEDVHLDRHVPEEIILSCELSRPNGAVGWFKDGQKLQESENIKLKYEGPYRRLKILSSRVEDSGEYVCDTADDSIFFHLSITEPPVQILSPSQSQMELCQQASERMVLSCEISRPNAVVRWYRDGLEVEESESLLLEVDGVYRRLIIPETTVRDSAEYVCDTGDDSVTFFVNIAEPPVRFLRPRKMASRVEKVVGETLVLDCEVSRSNAEVTWKKNGEEVEDSRKVTILEDGVARQLTIHSVTLEDTGQYVCDAKDDVMDFNVRVQDLPVRILGKTDAKTEKQFLVSDDIILVCELSNADASVRWHKDGQPIDGSQRFCCEEQGVFRSLVVLNAGLEDSGEYSCYAGDDKMAFTITVREPPVQIIGNSGNPEHHVMVTGDDLILECEVSRASADVEWTRNGEALRPSDRIRIDSYGVVRKLVLSGLRPSDSGEYVCEAVDDKLVTVVEVQDPPAKFLNKEGKNSMSAHENESVTLCAVVSSERANVRWLKDGQLLNKDNIHISSEGKTHKLTINPLQLSDSGEYVCDVSTDEMYFSLLVEEMKVKFVHRLENVISLKGKTLTLQCEVNKPKGDVQWLKDGKEITPSRRCTIRAQGRERSLTIQQLTDQDAGEYACESRDDRTAATVSIEAPRVVEFIAELRSITIREGEDAVFKCMVSPADTTLVWRLNGKDVALNKRTAVSCNGLCHMLCISSCLVSDSGRVTADAEGLRSEAELTVQEQQALFTKKMAAVVAEEFSEATLEVEVSQEAAEVRWMRQGILIHPGAKYTLKHRGRTHSLTVHQVAAADRGAYSCETLHDRTQAQLAVEPRKISIRRGLTDIKTTERETASFEVELSHPNVPGTWTRNGIQLKPTNHFRMSAKGEVHSLTITNLSVEDTGSFVFSVENLKTSARLVVKEPPVTIIRKLENQKVPDGSVISFDCELSRHNVDVKWLKDGVEVKPSKDVRIYAMGRKRFLQIMKCSAADSGLYACDAGDAATSCSVEVYERELLVLQGLEDLDIQEDQNAVFVCEISVEDVPGEWFKNGERIQPTSTVRIRQEGTKHFLLMCNVRSEDSGEIKFVARNAESVAFLEVEELPVNIVKPLQDTSAVEKSRVLLDCAVSNPRCSIRWYKGSNVVLPSERFEICSEGCYRKLIIQQVALEDEGTYSVQVGDHTCSAKLTVEAQPVLMVRELTDVAVSAPDDARFECEVSAAAAAPAWSLNGEPLQPGPRVRLEKMGTVHRLTLRQTAADMSGLVEFTSGKARSQAQLRVAENP